MRKHQKVQASASQDSKLGRRWEIVFENLLRACGVDAQSRQIPDAYSHEVDLYIPPGDHGTDCLISVAHVKQRNPKEKFYRLIDELCLSKSASPETKNVLVYIGTFLATEGWRDVLDDLFDSLIVLDEGPEAETLKSITDHASPFSSTILSHADARNLVGEMRLQTLAEQLLAAVHGQVKNQGLWQTSNQVREERLKLLNTDREQRILTRYQTQIRRPLLTAVCIPPLLRDLLADRGKAICLTDSDAEMQERLGTLTVHESILGQAASVGNTVLGLLQNSGTMVDDFERLVRKLNPVYASYLDDLYNPCRLEEMVTRFRSEVSGQIMLAQMVKALLVECRTQELRLSHSRVTHWVMEMCLIHAGISRNEMDKLLADRFPGVFPNARNVTGRYIYGTLKGTKVFSIEQYEECASNVLAGGELVENDVAIDRLIEDRRYAIAVIQNPRPLAAALQSAVDANFPISQVRVGSSEPTLVSVVFRERTGKSPGRLGVVPFQYVVETPYNRLLIRALSGFDRANINHKLKELCAKMLMFRLAESRIGGNTALCICVLDGEWSSDDQESLFLAGYDYVTSVPELPSLLSKIRG